MLRVIRKLLLLGALGAVVFRLVSELAIRRWRDNDRTPEPPRRIDGMRRTVDTDDGARLAVVETGSGSPVVLAHGIGGRGDHWAPVAERLAVSHRVIAYDQRGHGASTRGTDAYTPDRLGRDLLAVIDASGAEGAVVMGHSMGGIGTQAALAHGLAERAAALVLLSTVPRPTTTGLNISRRAIDWFLRICSHERHGLLMMRGGFGASPALQDLEEIRVAWAAMDADSFEDALRGLGDFDLTEIIAHCPLHVEVVCGHADSVTPRSFSRLIAGLIPDADLTLLPGVGHMALWEAVPEVIDAVERAAATAGSHVAG